jgi:hypothetical protein
LLRFPFDFERGRGPEYKFFILLGHVGTAARFLKPTSKTAQYDADPERLAGCVCYAAGECIYFRNRTVIDPADNQFEVRHYSLAVHASRGSLELCGTMPIDFHARLLAAIERSYTLDRRRRTWLRECLPPGV